MKRLLNKRRNRGIDWFGTGLSVFDRGQKGGENMTVKQKQHLLAYLGFYTAEADGIWGDRSKEATVAFQTRYMGHADGIFGAETEKCIRQIIANEEKTDSVWDQVRYFRRKEFCCTCCGRGCDGFPAEPDEQLVRNAESARIHFGAVADVSSGVRCKLRNGELPGSAANSLHLQGKAMDFRVRGIPAKVLCDYVKTLPQVDEAYAIDEQFVHMGVKKYERGN